MQDPNKLGTIGLKPCSKCGNPFMINLEVNSKPDEDLVCDNCIKLEAMKRELSINVIDDALETSNIMEGCIKEMKNNLTVSKGQFNKQAFLEKIKQRSQALTKSIELLQKIDDSKDEKYLDQYKQLFEDLKKGNT